MNGWIKFHRTMLEWEWYKTPNMVQFFTHCLLKANHEPKKWQGITIEAGQFISGRKQLSKETGLSEKSVRTCIERLKTTNELASKTTNKYSVFTIISWEKYQDTKLEGQQNGQQEASKRPAKGHKQELKELKENIYKSFTKPTIQEILEYAELIGSKIDCQYFFDHYESQGWKIGKAPMKDWKATVRNWERRRTGEKTNKSFAQQDKEELSKILEQTERIKNASKFREFQPGQISPFQGGDNEHVFEEKQVDFFGSIGQEM